ncbi:MAG: DUF2304 domain-containing protein [Nanoarchaeota archaeon]|nr:DUF2304 domain-containing protein [Nanoarchaeota archaeon]
MALSTTFWIQLLGIMFGTAMMYFTFVKYKRKELSKKEVLIWFAGWILMVMVAIKPSSLDFISSNLNFYRRLDFFVVLGFFVILGLGFFNYSTVKKLERKLERYVRKEAIEEAENKMKK